MTSYMTWQLFDRHHNFGIWHRVSMLWCHMSMLWRHMCIWHHIQQHGPFNHPDCLIPSAMFWNRAGRGTSSVPRRTLTDCGRRTWSGQGRTLRTRRALTADLEMTVTHDRFQSKHWRSENLQWRPSVTVVWWGHQTWRPLWGTHVLWARFFLSPGFLVFKSNFLDSSMLKNVGTTCLGVKFSPESIALVFASWISRIFELLITEVYFRPFFFEFRSFLRGGVLKNVWTTWLG